MSIRRLLLLIFVSVILASMVGSASINNVQGFCDGLDGGDCINIDFFRVILTAEIDKEQVNSPTTDTPEIITITGTAIGSSTDIPSKPLFNEPVRVKVFGPKGEEFKTKKPTYVGRDGSFKHEIVIAKDSPIGKYEVHVSVRGETQILEFEVVKSTYQVTVSMANVPSHISRTIFVNGEQRDQIQGGSEITYTFRIGETPTISVTDAYVDPETRDLHVVNNPRVTCSETCTITFETDIINIVHVKQEILGPMWLGGWGMRFGLPSIELILDPEVDYTKWNLYYPPEFMPTDDEDETENIDVLTVDEGDNLILDIPNFFQNGYGYQLRFDQFLYEPFSPGSEPISSSNPSFSMPITESGKLTIFWEPYVPLVIYSNNCEVSYIEIHPAGGEVTYPIPITSPIYPQWGWVGGEYKLDYFRFYQPAFEEWPEWEAGTGDPDIRANYIADFWKDINILVPPEPRSRAVLTNTLEFTPDWEDGSGEAAHVETYDSYNWYEITPGYAWDDSYTDMWIEPTSIYVHYTKDYTKLFGFIILPGAGIASAATAYKWRQKKSSEKKAEEEERERSASPSEWDSGQGGPSPGEDIR